MTEPTEAPEKPTITTDPDNPDRVLIHFPQFGYLDTQAWAAVLGIPAADLPALRDAITKHLHGTEGAGEQFGRAQRDVQDIVEKLGWADPHVVVRVLWDRFRRLPVDAEPAPEPTAQQIQDRICAEYQRRRARYDSGELNERARDNVAGELIGLTGALGIALGHAVPGGAADSAAARYYTQWLDRQDQPTDPNGAS